MTSGALVAHPEAIPYPRSGMSAFLLRWGYLFLSLPLGCSRLNLGLESPKAFKDPIPV